MKKVAVVILSWNGKQYLEKFLPIVIAHTNAELCEIIVADNLSSDGSVEYLKKNFPAIRVIENKRNGGYAGGYNDALALLEHEYFVLLNQDVAVSKGWDSTVIAEMEADKTIACAQPKLLDYNRPTYFEYAGASGGYIDMFGYPFCRGRVFDTTEEDKGQYNDTTEVLWASGACLFVRANAYRQVNGLDEDFFAHQEEIDLCWRLSLAGYKNVVVPQSVVYHVGGGSLQYGSPFKTYLNFRNNLFLIFKNLPLYALLWKLPVRMVLDGVAALQSVAANKNFKHLLAVLHAHFSFYAAIPKLLDKRKSVKQFKDVTGVKPYSVVWQYFVRKRKTFTELG